MTIECGMRPGEHCTASGSQINARRDHRRSVDQGERVLDPPSRPGSQTNNGTCALLPQAPMKNGAIKVGPLYAYGQSGFSTRLGQKARNQLPATDLSTKPIVENVVNDHDANRISKITYTVNNKCLLGCVSLPAFNVESIK